MSLLRLLVAFLCHLLLTGCATLSPENNQSPLDRVPQLIQTPTATIDQWPAVVQLGIYVLQGEMDNPVTQTRILRYQKNDDSTVTLDIALYPVPGGWEDLSSHRIVAGHYGQVRQALIDRALRRGATHIEMLNESLHQYENHEHPVAKGQLQLTFGQQQQRTHIELSLLSSVFVSATGTASEQKSASLNTSVATALQEYLEVAKMLSPWNSSSQQPPVDSNDADNTDDQHSNQP